MNAADLAIPSPANYRADKTVPGDLYGICAQLAELDPRLFVDINLLDGKFEIWIEDARLNQPQLVHVVEEDAIDPRTGEQAWRPLDQRVIHQLRQMDTQAENSYSAMVERRARAKDVQDAKRQEYYDSLRADLKTLGNVVGHKTTFYGYRPKTRARTVLPEGGLR